MRSRPSLAALVAAIAVLGLGGCGGIVDPSQNVETPFSDFVDPGQVGPEHEFTASRNGEFSIRFLTFAPAGAILQADFGQFFGETCQFLASSQIAGQDTTVLTGAISAGRYCVQMVDVGLITERVTYTIRVSHP